MVTLEGLTLQLLDVAMRGTCQMQVTGHTVQQRVRLEGMGSYAAPKLKSRRTTVELNGSGRVCIWAVEELDVTCRGLGRVEYLGTPTVRAATAVLTSVVRAQTQAEQAKRL
jgi:hypothetical protein